MAAEYVVDSLAGSRTVYGAVSVSNPAARSVRPTRAVLGYFFVVNGRLTLAAHLEDTARNHTLAVWRFDGPAEAGIGALARELVRRLDPALTPAGPRNEEAWKAYTNALSAAPVAAAAHLEKALAADPDFALAVLALIRLRAAMGDRAAAVKLLDAALSRRATWSPIHAARLELIAASLAQEPRTRFSALAHLALLIPADSDLAREAGDAAVAAHDLAAAQQWYERACRIEPANGLLWNQLGYAHAYRKDLKGAVEALERYRRLAPASANPLDSLGDVHFYLGRFASAEKHYLAAHGKDPRFLSAGTLLKAAQCRLMLGDGAAADALFEKYAAVRSQAHDPALEFTRAQWEYLRGKRSQAVQRLEPLAKWMPRAILQLVVWHLDMGQPEAARRSAVGAPLRASAQDAELLAIARFLSEPPASASQWALRAERAFPTQAAAKKYALAYALLFAKEYAAAALVLKEIVQRSAPGSTDNAAVLYGWALVETGKASQARPYLEVFPLPMPNGFSLFACLSYPRQLHLRRLV